MNVILTTIILFVFIVIIYSVGLYINKDKKCNNNYYVPINDITVISKEEDDIGYQIDPDTTISRYINTKDEDESLFADSVTDIITLT